MSDNSCQRCGRCCCNIPVTLKQAERIKNVLRNSPELTLSLFRPFNHNGCVFLIDNHDGTRTCAIYDKGVRPAVCKVFGTKGFTDLQCPHGYSSTEYTPQKAKAMIDKEIRLSKGKHDLMNSIMWPFIVKLAAEFQLAKEDK